MDSLDYPHPLNEYTIRTSHNTYGMKNRVDFKAFPSLITQHLEAGFRGMEIDVYQDWLRRIKVGHKGIDARFFKPSMIKFLKRVKKWRKQNKQHLPIIISIELLLPSHKKGRSKKTLHDVLKVFKSKDIFSPADLAEFRKNNPDQKWPLVNDLKGKLIFSVHKNTMDAFVSEQYKEPNDSRFFFVDDDNIEWSNFNYADIRDKPDKNDKRKEVIEFIKEGKLVRVYPQFEIVNLDRKAHMDVKDCTSINIQLAAVDGIDEGKEIFKKPYMHRSELI